MASPQYSSEDVALSLTLAVVSSSPEPLLLLDGQLVVVAASQSFSDQFDDGAQNLAGQGLYSLGTGEWNTPELRAVTSAALSGDAIGTAREMDLMQPAGPTRRLIVQARRLVYLDLAQTRILVAVSDVTDARADAVLKEDALRQNSVLLHEVRHRVANSLQIIASLLLQNARATESEEAREQLRNAHHRIMSVAAIERLLSTSTDGVIEVQAYFTSLCEHITTSMIGEFDHVTLSVTGDEGVVAARVSVSLGLIVTELVINALKYAFPDGRHGTITVDYNFHGPNWVLCVTDDGVGMPPVDTEAPGGLGTGIVQALARQLNASIEVAPQYPGTKVSIHHTPVALVREPSDKTEQGDTHTGAISGNG
jgi:two-component sensor histidine kinase